MTHKAGLRGANNKRLINKKDKPARSEKTGQEITITEEQLKDIEALLVEGKTYKDIANQLSLSYGTLLWWKFNAFPERFLQAEMRHELLTAQGFSRKLMSENATKKDTSLYAIQQKEAEFLRKHLLNAKNIYNDAPKVAVQINLPSPILDLGKLESE